MDDMRSWPVGRLLSTAARLVEHAWNAHLSQHDLTHAGLVVLHLLKDGPSTQRELAAASQVEDQTMSRTLERLERSGFVTRARDGVDRRRITVRRTSAGEQAFAAASGGDLADRLVTDGLADPERLRADLVAIVERLGGNRWGRVADSGSPSLLQDANPPRAVR
jgi:MarR family transcriptional regulator, organic hydroperoxide resistance regulator